MAHAHNLQQPRNLFTFMKCFTVLYSQRVTTEKTLVWDQRVLDSSMIVVFGDFSSVKCRVQTETLSLSSYKRHFDV